MNCDYQEFCGGCSFRGKDFAQYKSDKENAVKNILKNINQPDIKFGKTVFFEDESRRRTTMTFAKKAGHIKIGYNQNKSHEIFDCYKCLLLSKKINANLLNVRRMIDILCQIPFVKKEKKKIVTSYLQNGDVHICEADNGLDLVLEFDKELGLEHRMQIFEMGQKFVDIIRISHRRKPDMLPEVIMEKARPVTNVNGYDIFIAPGAFLQASKQAQTALINLVLKYAGDKGGKYLDLFCGAGTFSYPLAADINKKIIAADSSKELLKSFETSVNAQMIPNIKIVCKNLFKYPFSGDELKNCEAVVFDPPRAGAKEQIREIAKLEKSDMPHNIIAVSCNTHTFVNDANMLIEAGYKIKEITIVDQFIYSPHAELVALFEI